MQKKILWVDDEIEFLRSHVEFLESRGYGVTAVSSGGEAVRLLSGRGGCSAFDVVLLDKQMPRKSGRATLESIRALCPDLPVVMLSGCRHDSDAALQKFDGLLLKPIDHERLLLACRRAIDLRGPASSALSDKYMRDHSANRALIGGAMNAADWASLYLSLVKWDIEMEGGVVTEGVRQAHAGMKSDCGRLFCDFAAENYAQWARGGGGRAFTAADVLERAVIPELREGRSVVMAVVNGTPLGEFLTMEPEIKKRFSAARALFMSALPTTFDFCVPVLLSGRYMDEVEEADPRGFMRAGLDLAGMRGVNTYYARADGTNVRDKIKAAAKAAQKGQTFAAVVVDAGADAAANIAGDTGPAVNSELLSMLGKVCGDALTVILTSAHGRVSCGRASEVYEHAKVCGGLRCLFSPRVSVDEREAFLLEHPSHFRLPRVVWDLKCVMARENYYFTLPGAKRKQKAGSRSGGISLEEMVMPLYVCRPPLAGRAGQTAARSRID